MKITCISTSNTQALKSNSASTKVCQLIKDMILTQSPTFEVNIETLMDHDLKPCNLCGSCLKDDKCIYDEDFTSLYQKIKHSDALFFVVPHYSPIPSKLIILFEKINQVLISNWANDHSYQSPLKHIKVGIIGHGGMPQEKKTLDYYHEHLVTPIARTLKSLSFQIIGTEEYENGAVFGLKDDQCIVFKDNKLLPDIIQDYDLIRNRINPLVSHMIKELN